MVKEVNGEFWYFCPFCDKKLFPVESDTTAHNLPQKCRGCRRIIKVNIQSR